MTAWLVLVGVALVAGFLLGAIAGRRAAAWQLENDQPYRRELLERLAQEEGARLELRG